MKKILVATLAFFILLLPFWAGAQVNKVVPQKDFESLVPPCPDNNCGYSEFITLIWNVIYFLTFYLAIPLATVSILWGGVLYLWSAATPAKKDQGKKIITTAIWGLVLALAAQLVVVAILNFFIEPGKVKIPEPKPSSVLWGIEQVYAEDGANDTPSGVYSPGVQTPTPAPGASPFQILRFKSIRDFILAIIDLAVRVGWPLMVLAIIWVGFLFVKARGNESKITEAKNAAQYTAIGIAIILGATLIKEILEATIKELVK